MEKVVRERKGQTYDSSSSLEECTGVVIDAIKEALALAAYVCESTPETTRPRASFKPS